MIMIIRKTFVSLAAAGLVLGSTAAAAAPVAMDDVRVGSSVGQAEEIGSFGWVVALLLALGVLGVILADDSEDPVSS